ncbi:hypothetical protein H072_7076 [Dactylellina haptotyla CBS 200.50]|uniref:Delta 8-(E)-sphingolipid desaturase n=1 Tax=Dactylellina haptotyla (strain CBS 200.50) TaxID=1284197 RepID=S8ADH5_DACHA|nr:hypothetical protein H072_7076 [Dactylellina haptotyla CBS 200.50]
MGGPTEEKLFTRREIEGLIAEGRKVIIVDDKVLKVDPWLKYHPGGDKAIMHMVGRDATDEVTALHSAATKQMMLKFKVGRIQGPWVNFKPPIQGGKFRVIGDDCPSENDLAADFTNVAPSDLVSSGATTPTSSGSERDYILDPRLRRRKAPADSSSISSVSDAEDEATLSLRQEAERRLQEDLDKYPSLDMATQQNIIAKYRELDQKLRDKGMYQCNYWAYGVECLRYSLCFGLFLYFLNTGWYKLSAVFLGFFWHQLTFTAHDAGHMGITHNFAVDTFIGIFIADFCGGLSIGWWKRNHNVHHIVTNEPDHDPDIQHLPFFAIDQKFFKSLYSTYYDRVMEYDAFARFVIRAQHWLYYPMLGFGRLNLYRLSWEYILLGQAPKKGIAWWHRYAELSALTLFWVWYGYFVIYRCIPTTSDRIIFFCISHVVPFPVHVQITLSHFAMSTSDIGVAESFPQRMIRTTMDVDCPEWLDFFHGGLQFQVIHHLYPRMPRHNLRAAQKDVMEFCKEVGLPYALYGFYEGNKAVIGHLAEISKQAAIFKECQQYCMENPGHAH